MNNFSIEVPNARAASYKIITAIILLMNVLVSAYLCCAGSNYRALCSIGLIINLLCAFAVFSKKKVEILQTIRPEIIFIINAVIWLILGKYLLGILMLVFAVMGLYTNRKLVILFNEEGIVYPSFPQKIFTWQEVSQVVLKDDILTIDLNNNQLLQFNITPVVAETVDVAAFNLFCRTYMGKR